MFLATQLAIFMSFILIRAIVSNFRQCDKRTLHVAGPTNEYEMAIKIIEEQNIWHNMT